MNKHPIGNPMNENVQIEPATDENFIEYMKRKMNKEMKKEMSSEKKDQIKLMFHDNHMKGETTRFTVSFFLPHNGLKAIKDDIIEDLIQIIKKKGYDVPKDIMIVSTGIITQDEAENC